MFQKNQYWLKKSIDLENKNCVKSPDSGAKEQK